MEDTIVLEQNFDNDNDINLIQDEPIDEIDIPTSLPQRPRMKPKLMNRQKRFEQSMRQDDQGETEGIDAFMNPNKRAQPTVQKERSIDYGEIDDDMGFNDFNDAPDQGFAEEEIGQGYSSTDEEKADLLNKLERLKKKGHHINSRINAYSGIHEIRTEYNRVKYAIDTEAAVKFSRRMLVACVTGLEFMNKRFDPLALQLDGWSESIMENVDDYDPVFEELYAKYKTKVAVAPEVRLIMMLGGSAMMFHLTNSMFKTAIPNMNDVMKQNPDLLKNMVSAVQNTAQNGRTPAPQSDPTQRPVTPVGSDGRREMQGPGFDLSSLMGGISMPPPPPMNTRPVGPKEPVEEDEGLPTLEEVQAAAQNIADDDLSDIVSISGESTQGETREIAVKKPRKTRKKKSDKKEISL